MKRAALFLLVAISSVAFSEHLERVRENRRMRPFAGGMAAFEAFPANGTGTPKVACSTTAPTGTRGEVLTFTRASAGMCTKTATGGLATTGIADGDLVSLSSNVARVEYDSAGVLGLLVEATRTNSTLRSQELTNVAWALAQAAGAAAVTRTADHGTAPDGTATAERFEIPATTAVQATWAYQLGACPLSVAATHTLYVRGVSGSGTMDLCVNNTPACASCAFVSTSWTRCSVQATADGTGASYIGNMSLYNGGTARSANDVLVWGAQCENGAYLTSYIPTTSASVTRATEVATFVNSVPISAGSSAASISFPTTSPSVWYGLTWGNSAEGPYGISDARCYDGTTQAINAATYVAGVPSRNWCSWSGSALTAGAAATSTTVAFDGTMGTGITTMSLGQFPGPTNHIDGLIGRICVDPDPLRCR